MSIKNLFYKVFPIVFYAALLCGSIILLDRITLTLDDITVTNLTNDDTLSLSHPVRRNMPYSGENRYLIKGDVTLNTWSVTEVQIRAEHAVDHFTINDRRVNLTGPHTNFGRIFTIDLVPYLIEGDNRFQAEVVTKDTQLEFHFIGYKNPYSLILIFITLGVGFLLFYELLTLALPYLEGKQLLRIAALLIYLRFFYPFFANPFDTLCADCSRHLSNGVHLLNPTHTGNKDPFLYQLWLYIWYSLSFGCEKIMQLSSAILCASLPWFWYRFLREFLPRIYAEVTTIVIAVLPSFLVIYGYFMPETLLLNMIALAFWMTWRSKRKTTLGGYGAACICWILASLTHVIAAPLGIICVLYLLCSHKQFEKRLLIGLGLLTLFMIIPALHSYKHFNYLAPFGHTKEHRIHFLSGAKEYAYSFITPYGHHYVSSASHTASEEKNIIPFSDWQPSREGTYQFTVDSHEGRRDWDVEIDILLNNLDMDKALTFMKENTLLFLFDGSHPEITGTSALHTAYWVNRLIWAPLALALLILTIPVLFLSISWDKKIFMTIVFSFFIGLCAQHYMLLEGSLRKSVEPLMIISAATAIYAIRSRIYAKSASLSGKKSRASQKSSA